MLDTLPHWPGIHPPLPVETSLERTLALLAKLGNPHYRLPPTIHVAGTNGKGSTLAFLKAMLEAGGYRVHRYISPHLQHFHERIELAGLPIADATLQDVIARTRTAHDGSAISFFEGTTAAAMLAFRETPADALLLETGMGGRFDPTNVIPHPVCTIITPIHYDHTRLLGNTLEQIAWHKAGILKPGVPCIISHQLPEVLAVIKTIAAEIGAPLLIYGEHWAVQKTAYGFDFVDNHGATPFPAPSLVGDHQLMNAGCAIAALTVLDGFTLAGDHMAYGLTHAHWPGRLEKLTFQDGYELWCDGGHNPSAAQIIAHQLAQWPPMPTIMIFGTTQGKDLSQMLRLLAPHLHALYAVAAQAEINAMPPVDIQTSAIACGITAFTADSVSDALYTITMHHPAPCRIIVFGSLFLRSDVT